MKDQNHPVMPLLGLAILAVTLFSLYACEVQIDNNLPNIPPTGRYAVVAANQHSGQPFVQVGAAIFDNGKAVSLVGGDVVEASTSLNQVLLLNQGFYTGSYVASLANASNLNQVDFQVVHKPIAARAGRWYPVDLLYIDPGPGEFVGASASVILPPEPLNLSSNRYNFTSINDSFTINWSAGSAGDTIKVRSAISCTNGSTSSSYGTEAALTDYSDDGTQDISMDQFIYDLNSGNIIIQFIRAEAQAMLQELLEKLSNGAVDDDFLSGIVILNPATSNCDIRLFLFRERPGSFDSTSTNGNIFASRSTEITLYYRPPATLNSGP